MDIGVLSSLVAFLMLVQGRNEERPDARARRHSNENHRKRSLADRILMFLMRMRRRMPFDGLRILSGVSVGTAHNYYMEMLKLFWNEVMPRLLHPRSWAEIGAMTPAQIELDLPGAKLIFDLTAFPWKSKENV